MALYAAPTLNGELPALLSECDDLRGRISGAIARPDRWVGVLRREVEADAYSSSTRIEGFDVDAARIKPVVFGAEPVGEAEAALAWYTHAMRHVGAMATDEHFEWNLRAILDLHFDACAFQSDSSPGRLRTGPARVVATTGRIAYEAPPAPLLFGLMSEFVAQLRGNEELHPLVAGAMAHLNLVSIHPFADGNGRLSRIVQSLVLALRGETVGEFGSIEPNLARDSASYYAVLESVQGGSFQPGRSALEWVEFCLAEHRRGALDRLKQIEAASARWMALESLLEGRGWPDRFAIAMERAIHADCDRSSYANEANVSSATATNDLRRLLDAGFLELRGAGPSTHYAATPALRTLAQQ